MCLQQTICRRSLESSNLFLATITIMIPLYASLFFPSHFLICPDRAPPLRTPFTSYLFPQHGLLTPVFLNKQNTFRALYRTFTECCFIEDEGDIVFYKNGKGETARAVADDI